MLKSRWWRVFKNNADVLVAWTGIVAGLAVLGIFGVLRILQPVGLALTVILACGIYIWRRDFYPTETLDPSRLEATPFWGRWLPLVSTLALEFLVWLMVYVSVDSLGRPTWVFVLLTLIPLWILWLSSLSPRMVSENILLLQLGLWVTGMVLSSITVFPHNGSDTWAHLYNAQTFLENGSAQAIRGGYHDFPLYSSWIGSLALLTGWPIEFSARFISLFGAILSLLLVYLLAQALRLERSLRILAVLLLGGNKWFIYWNTYVVSMSAGLSLFVAILFLFVLRMFDEDFRGPTLGMVVLLLAAPFFHPFIASLMVIGIWGVGLIRFVQNLRPPQYSLLTLPLLATVIMLAQWLFYGTFFEKSVSGLIKALSFDSSSSLALAVSYRSPWIFSLDNINYFLLLGFALYGLLRQIRRLARPIVPTVTEQVGFALAGMGFALVGVGLVAQIINLQAVLPHRWYMFGIILLTFSAARAAASFALPSGKFRMALAFALLGVYFFTGLANTESNRDRPFYGEAVTVQYELTRAEYSGIEYVQKLVDSRPAQPVRVDFLLWDYLKLVKSPEDRITYWVRLQPDGQEMFVFREVYTRRRILAETPTLQFNDPCLAFARVYDSGNFWMFDNAARKSCP